MLAIVNFLSVVTLKDRRLAFTMFDEELAESTSFLWGQKAIILLMAFICQTYQIDHKAEKIEDFDAFLSYFLFYFIF